MRKSLIEPRTAPRRASELAVSQQGVSADFFAKAFADAARKPAYPGARSDRALCAGAATLPFAEGEQVEAGEFERLRKSASSQALRHLFFAERQAAKIPGLAQGRRTAQGTSVGVVGAGTMAAASR